MREIAIVGGGFGGVRAAKKLARWGKDIHITLIDKDRYHTFYPDLYEVATANLSEVFAHLPLEFYELRSTAACPLEDIFFDDSNVTVLRDEVTGIDLKKNELSLKSGAIHPYELLVLSAGSETNYFNIPGLFDHAFPLKTLWDALSLRNALDELFMRTPKNHSISIAIGGGGFTGCEFAGELCHYAHRLAQQHGYPADALSITMIEASATLLPGIDPRAQVAAAKRLHSLGVQMILNSPITEVEHKNVVLKDGSRVPFDLLVWTAGVRANKLTNMIPDLKLEKNFCVVIDEYLRIQPFSNIFSIGDMTYCIDPKTGRSMPMTATVAMAQADRAADNIIATILKKPLSKYTPSHSGFIVPLGGRYAIVATGHFYMEGFIPWALKHLVTLHYWAGVIGWKKAFAFWKKGIKIFLHNDTMLPR